MNTRLYGKSLLFASLSTLLVTPAFADHYTVRSGDNLTTIAHRAGVSLHALALANPGVGILQPGQKLRLPGDSSPRSTKPLRVSRRKRSTSEESPAPRRFQVRLKAEKADRRRARLFAQLAEWKTYKRDLARQRRKAALRRKRHEYLADLNHERRLEARSRHRHDTESHRSRIARRKREQIREQLAEWRTYRKHLVRLEAKQQAHRLALAEKKRHHHHSRKEYAESSSHRPTVRIASRLLSHTAPGSRIVRTALAYRGARYVYGADGNGAYDCSGFTRTVIRRVVGVSLPHKASEQYDYGNRVSRSSLKPGDLLFFHTNRPGISHVGIYIGEGRFVHAANPRRGVTTDSLSSSFYGHRWVGARRIHR